jgi:hypothetical protein
MTYGYDSCPKTNGFHLPQSKYKGEINDDVYIITMMFF